RIILCLSTSRALPCRLSFPTRRSSDLASVIEGSQPFLTAVIEGTPQSGMSLISGKVPTVRLLSFNQDYVDRRLRPADLVDKYLLAVSERNVRLLYLRPYTTTELGDPLANTERMISALSAEIGRASCRERV